MKYLLKGKKGKAVWSVILVICLMAVYLWTLGVFMLCKDVIYIQVIYTILVGVVVGVVIAYLVNNYETEEGILKCTRVLIKGGVIIFGFMIAFCIGMVVNALSYNSMYIRYIGTEYFIGQTEYNLERIKQHATMLEDYCEKENYEGIRNLVEYRGNSGYIKTIVDYNNSLYDLVQNNQKNLREEVNKLRSEYGIIIAGTIGIVDVVILFTQACELLILLSVSAVTSTLIVLKTTRSSSIQQLSAKESEE